MTRADIRRHYKNWHERTTRKYVNPVEKALMSQVTPFIEALQSGDIARARNVANKEIFNEELMRVLRKIHLETGVQFLRKWTRELRTFSRKRDDPEGWAVRILQYFRDHNLELVGNITATTRNYLLSVLEEGIQNRDSIEEIVNKIIESDIFRQRAYVIARTEVTRGSNAGTMIAGRNYEFIVDKVWITAHDFRVRGNKPKDKFSHVVLDGAKAGLEAPFNNGENLLQPCDPDASAGNTVNCRCTISLRPRRDEQGRLIPKESISFAL